LQDRLTLLSWRTLLQRKGGKIIFFRLLDFKADRIFRAAVFFQGTAATVIATVVAIPLSWLLLKKSMFVPMSVSVGFMFLGTLVVLLVPETLNRSLVPDPAEETSGSDVDSGDEGGLLNPHKQKTIVSVIVRKIEDSRFIFSSPMLCALAVAFLVQSLHGVSISLLFQFASERFHWSLADVRPHFKPTSNAVH
jgi:hypothetical protein